jgi:hypothetical protein
MCCFYETTQDLLDTLVPYFKAGLENHEFCLWVISKPLTEEEARRALQQAVPDLHQYLAEHSIEILPHDTWYLQGDALDLHGLMVQFPDQIGTPIQLLYYPPSQSTYNPIERCWGILALHWNGTKLVDVETMLEWAKSMTWKGIHPVVELSRKVYQKGIVLSKKAMQAIESRLERHPALPKWDMPIRPAAAL